MGLRDTVAAFKDVREELVAIPEWGGVEILFRGISFASLYELQKINLTAASEGTDINEVIRLVQATACDPETGELAFTGEEGERILRSKSFSSILFCVNNGSNVVLGIDAEQTAGKGSSSTATETPTPPA